MNIAARLSLAGMIVLVATSSCASEDMASAMGNVKLGGEIGIATKFCKGFTGEVWAGPVARL